jgi:hypothetical protein
MKTIPLLFVAGLQVLLLSCGRPFTTVAPDGFATYRKGGKVFRSVSCDRVVYRVRHLKNRPYAGFDFWREALPKRMGDAGYRIISDTVITVDKQSALVLEMATPVGDYDYSYMLMMQVKGSKILLAEAAGVVNEFQKRKKSILATLKKTVIR